MEKPKMKVTRRGILKAGLMTMLAGSAVTVGGGYYTTQVEPFRLKLERRQVPITGLPESFEGYRIVQLSDLHHSDAESRKGIQKAVEIALDQNPDLIVLTGDYVTGHLNPTPLHKDLKPLSAPDGVWTILGNHDHWVDPGGVRQVIADAGIIELRNTAFPITRNSESIWLAGVDDIWENQQDLESALADIPNKAPTILLAHEPDFADQVYPTGRVSLQLSGHSHGGQVRIPLLGAPILPHLGQKYPYGLRKLGDMWLYTNRGVGTIPPSVRLNCRPEVTEITLVGAI